MKTNKWKSYLILTLMLYYVFGTMERVVYDMPFTMIDAIQYVLSFAIGIFVLVWAISSIQ